MAQSATVTVNVRTRRLWLSSVAVLVIHVGRLLRLSPERTAALANHVTRHIRVQVSAGQAQHSITWPRIVVRDGQLALDDVETAWS